MDNAPIRASAARAALPTFFSLPRFSPLMRLDQRAGVRKPVDMHAMAHHSIIYITACETQPSTTAYLPPRSTDCNSSLCSLYAPLDRSNGSTSAGVVPSGVRVGVAVTDIACIHDSEMM